MVASMELTPWNGTVIGVVGEGRAGKTSLINALLGKPSTQSPSTIGVDTYSLSISETMVSEGGRWRKDDHRGNMFESEIAEQLKRKKREKEKASSSSPNAPTTTPPLSSSSSAPSRPESQPTLASHNESNRGSTSNPEKKEPKVDQDPFSVAIVKEFDEEACMKRLGDIKDDDSGLRIALHDFGGQPVFYSLHHLFINKSSFYTIVFNMGDLLVTDPVKLKESKQFLEFWIESITIHTLHANQTAQVAFVGTHKDKYNNASDHDKIHTILSQLVEGAPIANSMLENINGEGMKGTTTHYFFPVDNTKGTADPTIVQLMDCIVSTVKEASHVRRKKPVTWLKFVDLIKVKQATATYISYSEAFDIAKSVGIPGKDFDHLLKFLHDMSILMWFDDGFLKQTIILDPFEFLVKAITTVVCKHVTTEGDPTNHSTDASKRCKKSHLKDWKNFMKTAIVTNALLFDLLAEWSAQAKVIVQLMINFSIMVPLVASDETGASNSPTSSSTFIIPCLLPETETPFTLYQTLGRGKRYSYCVFLFTVNDLLDTSNKIERADIKGDACLPTGLFSRLLGKVVAHCQEFPENTLHSMIMYRSEITSFIGSQQFRVRECIDEKYILLEIEGSYALNVFQVVQDMIQSALDECMKSLKCVCALPYTSTGSDGDMTTVECFIPLELMQNSASKGIELHLSQLVLTDTMIREKYSPFLARTDVTKYDVFLSYRWGDYDSKLVNGLFDGASRKTVGEDHRQVIVFKDDERLKIGEDFQFAFAGALFNTSTVVLIVSAAGLQRLVTHDPNVEDNVLIEWLLSLECSKETNNPKKSRVEKILPIMIGEVDLEENIGSLFECENFKKISTKIPVASIQKVKRILESKGFTPSPQLDTYTVKDILGAITKGLGIQMNEKPKKKIMDIVDKIMEALNDCKGVNDITAQSLSSSSSHDHSQAVITSSGNDGSSVVSNLRSEVEANRHDKAYEILKNEENCKKGKFGELCEFLEDELGLTSVERLMKATIELHKEIADKYLKRIPRDEYMSLVSNDL